MPRWAIIVAIVVVVIVVAVAAFLLMGRGGEGVGIARYGPLSVQVLSVERGVEAIKVKAAEASAGGVTVEAWNLCYPKKGLNGVLIRLKVSNSGDEIYAVGFTLITSKGRQLGVPVFSDPGVVCTVTSPTYATSEQKVLLEKAKEYPYEMLPTIMGQALEIAPGASLERVLLFGLEPGEEPAKLHVTAKSISGKVVEFDVEIKK